MPVFTHVFDEHNLLVSQFSGPITDELVIGYYEHLLSFADSTLLFVELVDFRDVGDAHISSDTLPNVARMIADAYMPIDSRIQCAVVAPSDLGFGMARMYELGEAPEMIDVRVFDTSIRHSSGSDSMPSTWST